MEYYNELPPTSLTAGATDRAFAAASYFIHRPLLPFGGMAASRSTATSKVSSESAAYWQGTNAKPLDALTTTLLQLTTFPNDSGVSMANP